MSDWELAAESFLGSRRSENTRRAYAFVLAALVKKAGMPLGEVGKRDVADWVNGMRSDGLAESTIGQRLAAVSSFFDYAADVFDLEKPNPARGRSLRGHRVSQYGNAVWLDVEQAKALLGSIDRGTARGKRDYALFLGYLLLGKRNSEWRTVQVKDLAGGHLHWKGKGKEGRVGMPRPLKDAVDAHLRALGWEAAMRNGVVSAFVFPGQENDRPISAEQVRNLLRKYVKLAGLEGGIHVHSLRHSAAMLRKSAGEDVLSLQRFLDHSNVNTTQIYLHALKQREDLGWVKVSELLGLS
jgi:site-specific recombinase XerD